MALCPPLATPMESTCLTTRGDKYYLLSKYEAGVQAFCAYFSELKMTFKE